MKEIISTVSLILGVVDFTYVLTILFQVYQDNGQSSISITRVLIPIVLLAIFVVILIMCSVSDDENDLGSVK